MQIDLEEEYEIHLIQVWRPYNYGLATYHDVVIQTATNEEITSNVHTLFNNDYNNTLGLGKGKDKEYYETNWGRTIKGTGKLARYLRLHSNGCTEREFNQLIEVEVYGRKPIKTNPHEKILKELKLKYPR